MMVPIGAYISSGHEAYSIVMSLDVQNNSLDIVLRTNFLAPVKCHNKAILYYIIYYCLKKR